MIAGVIFFVIGTEIRVRAEEQLLATRFGDEFEKYSDYTGLPAISALIEETARWSSGAAARRQAARR